MTLRAFSIAPRFSHAARFALTSILLGASLLISACGGGGGGSNTNPVSSSAVLPTSAPTPSNFALSVSKTGSGTVTSSSGGINCGTSCSASYASGTSVTLTASAATGYSFSGWGGACSSTGATCTVSMTAASSVTATFTQTGASNYTLTVSNTGSGTVTSSPGGINCGTSCSSSYASGTSVTLTASAATGYSFTVWGGACSGTTASCAVSMTAARSVTATFSQASSVSAIVGVPVLSFSDIHQGPSSGLTDGLGSGAIVTLWGFNLGSSQGASKVYVGSDGAGWVAAAYVYYWKNADGTKPGGPSDLYTRQKMQEVAISVPAGAATGAQKIKVVVNGLSSNQLDFTVTTVPATFQFVSATGTDNSTCGTWNSPCSTVQYTLENRNPGTQAFIYIVGDYAYTSTGGAVAPLAYDGTPTAYNVLTAYPNSAVVFTGGGVRSYSYPLNRFTNYWTASKISVHTDGQAFMAGGAYRYVGNAATTITRLQSGAGIVGNEDYLIGGWKYYGNWLHNVLNPSGTGDNQEHVMYFTHRHWDVSQVPLAPVDIAWNRLNDNTARFGIHFYDEHNCGQFSHTGKSIIHDNWIENQEAYGIGFNGPTGYCNVPDVWDVGQMDVYNNVLINAGQNSQGFSGNYTTAMEVRGGDLRGTVNFYNNTIYGYAFAGCTGGPGGPGWCTAILNDSANNITWSWVNNLSVDTHNLTFDTIYNSVNPATHINNLWYSTSGQPAPSWDTSPVTTDPLLKDVGNSDFSLQSGSPAIDAGTTGPARDVVGVTRPQGSAPDIGAYEFVQ